MRQLKFRVWDNLKKIWLCNQQIWRIRTDVGGIGEILPPAIYWKQHPQGLSIQQFTGRTDKNSKEIFEGDILKVTVTGTILMFCTGVYVASVEWDDEFCCWSLNIVPSTKDKYKRFNRSFTRDSGRCYEVIGNIFENKNLLK